MTLLEIILSITLYLIVGLWICFKCNWYEDFDYPKTNIGIVLVLMPLFLIYYITDNFIIKPWKL